jgi:hypothetical protein
MVNFWKFTCWKIDGGRVAVSAKIRAIDGSRQPKPAVCELAWQLLDSFGSAVEALVALHEQQFRAILAGDENASRFDLLIHDANDRKQNAKYAYMTHCEIHGCSLSRWT